MVRLRSARIRSTAMARLTDGAMHRFMALAVAVTAVAASPLRAQVMVPDSADAPAALAGLRASALRPGSWTYASTVTRAGASVELARRTLTIAPAEHEGAAAWLLLDRTSARGQVMTDSLLVARDDLRPLRRSAEMGPVRITLGFRGDSAVGAMSAPGGDALRLAVAAGATPLVANGAMLEAALRLLPLAPGWRGSVSQLAPTPAGLEVVPVTLAVTAEESVTVPAGTFAAWVVTATSGGVAQRLWVARAGGVLLRQQASPPHAPDVVFEMVLVEAPPPL